jgi:hypothetical protein
MTELLAAARMHFENEIVPVARQTNFRLYFQTLVAINVLKIVEREYTIRPYHLRAEWTRLNMFLVEQSMPAQDDDLEVAIQRRNEELCQGIRAGHYDEDFAMFQHLIARTNEQLEVANPKYLQTVRLEGKEE